MTLKRNLIANYIGQGWVALMGLAFIPQYIKYLGIEAYGLIGLFAVLQAWLGLLDMGMTPTLGREMARFTGGGHSNESIRDLLRSIEMIALGIALLIAGSIAIGAHWIASSWLKAEAIPVDVVAQAFTIMGFVTALRFAEGIYRSAIIGLQRQVLFNVVNSIMATLRGLGSVGILIWVSPTIKAFFLWQAVVSVVTLMILAITTYSSLPRGVRRGHFSIDSLQSVWRFAGGMVTGTLTGLLLSATDKILISRYLPLSDLGYYSLANTVIGILGVMLGPVNQAVFPRFAELIAKNKKSELELIFLKSSQMVSVFLGTIAIILIFQGKNIIFIWSGDEKLASMTGLIVSILASGILISSPTWMLYQLQIAYGKPSIGVYINIANIIFTLPILLVVTSNFGLIGTALVTVLSSLISLVLHIFLSLTLNKYFKVSFYDWGLKSIVKPILLVFLLNLVCFLIWPNSISNKYINLMSILFLSFASFWVSFASAKLLRDSIVNHFMILKFFR